MIVWTPVECDLAIFIAAGLIALEHLLDRHAAFDRYLKGHREPSAT